MFSSIFFNVELLCILFTSQIIFHSCPILLHLQSVCMSILHVSVFQTSASIIVTLVFDFLQSEDIFYNSFSLFLFYKALLSLIMKSQMNFLYPPCYTQAHELSVRVCFSLYVPTN